MDYCPDHGIERFRNYVALDVVAKNIHRIGDILYNKEQQKLQRQARMLKAANSNFTLVA